MKIIKYFLLFITIGLSSNVLAADTSLKYGVLFGGTSFSVNDPEGDTKDNSSASLFNIALLSPLTGGKRLFIHGYNHTVALDADTVNLGQDVRITGATVSLQFDIFNVIWLGAGLGVTQESYENRFTTDVTGNYVGRSKLNDPNLKDESFVTFPIVLSISKEWQVNKSLSFGAHFTFTKPIGGRTGYVSALAGVYF